MIQEILWYLCPTITIAFLLFLKFNNDMTNLGILPRIGHYYDL
ncbi:hypothetical protein BJQ97_00709 [Geobacillus sp. TFV-3]|nr:hypothetical protein BJQ97_00709 [Geobacillus sp. TFV-3]